MTARPYELLARFDANGNVVGVSVKTITTVDGRDYESDPQPLSGASDAAFTAFASQFSSAVVAQRDSLLSQLDSLALEKNAEIASLTSQKSVEIASLTATNNAAIAAITSEKSAIVAERDSLQLQVSSLTAQVASLNEQLDAALNPPVNTRHVAPFTFLGRFTPEEIYSLLTSNDPVVVVGVAKLQTIITYVDLDLDETQYLIGYLVQTGMISEQRAQEILA